mmetsp:Transcript_41784/g.111371  ORF Transcript_41784/g.111371 Transcript_41784/m.111371 type:complete len:216 (-) Transcript_41784:1173-1820(-)
MLGFDVPHSLVVTCVRFCGDLAVIFSGASTIRRKPREWAHQTHTGHGRLRVRDSTDGVGELRHALPLPPCNSDRSPRTPREVARMVEDPLVARPRSPDSDEARDRALLPLFVCSLLILTIHQPLPLVLLELLPLQRLPLLVQCRVLLNSLLELILVPSPLLHFLLHSHPLLFPLRADDTLMLCVNETAPSPPRQISRSEERRALTLACAVDEKNV